MVSDQQDLTPCIKELTEEQPSHCGHNPEADSCWLLQGRWGGSSELDRIPHLLETPPHSSHLLFCAFNNLFRQCANSCRKHINLHDTVLVLLRGNVRHKGDLQSSKGCFIFC